MQSPYEILGEAGIRQLVASFYQRMDSESRYAEIRAMHAQDLGPVQEFFSQYLISWMGGPPVYMKSRGSMCITAAHKPLGIEPRHSQQWLDCFVDALQAQERDDTEQLQQMLMPPLQAITRMLEAKPTPDYAV